MTAAITVDPKALHDVGAHFGYSKTRRHPTASKFVFTTKEKTDMFDLEVSAKALEKALEKVAAIAAAGKQVLFVGGKQEVIVTLKNAAERAAAPFVAGRWIGGTLTNFKQIRKRIDRMEKLKSERERGERDKYTKLERLMLDREIAELEFRFGGLADMRDLPGALFVIDPSHESIAVEEAIHMNIPVIALMSSDCNFSKVQFPIPANDSTTKSVRFIAGLVAESYSSNKRAPQAAPRVQGEE
jgi:small subunit ribosomal protein S2